MIGVLEAAALLVAGAACVTDVTRRRVPNGLTFPAALAGLLYSALVFGWPGLSSSAGGLALGLLVYLPLFALRGMGGGDVKLMGALGALVGPSQVLMTALYAALAGGVLALGLTVAKGILGPTLRNVGSLVLYWRAMGLREHPTISIDAPGAVRLPYALPIAIGLMAALWWR